MTAANDLLRAIHATLAGDPALTQLIGADGILDRLTPRRPFPYLVIGAVETRPYGTSTEAGEEHFLTIEVWTEANGSRSAHDIAATVRALLCDTEPVLANHVLVNLGHRWTRVRRAADTRCHMAQVQFRAVTE